MATAATVRPVGAAGRERPWTCGVCAATLGTLVLARGGHARLVLALPALAAQEVCGHALACTCARCGATKTWHTSAPACPT